MKKYLRYLLAILIGIVILVVAFVPPLTEKLCDPVKVLGWFVIVCVVAGVGVEVIRHLVLDKER